MQRSMQAVREWFVISLGVLLFCVAQMLVWVLGLALLVAVCMAAAVGLGQLVA